AADSSALSYQSPPPARRDWPTRTGETAFASVGRPCDQASSCENERLSYGEGHTTTSAPAIASCLSSSETKPSAWKPSSAGRSTEPPPTSTRSSPPGCDVR